MKAWIVEGNIVKYITRAARRDNKEDLLKAQHYPSKLLEITLICLAGLADRCVASAEIARIGSIIPSLHEVCLPSRKLNSI